MVVFGTVVLLLVTTMVAALGPNKKMWLLIKFGLTIRSNYVKKLSENILGKPIYNRLA